MTRCNFRFALPALLVMSALASSAHAFTESQTIRPVKVLGFTGKPALGGAFPGVRPFTPPVYLPGSGQLLGLTQEGGDIWTEPRYQQQTEGGILYTLQPDGTAYNAQPLDSRFGQQNSLLTLNATGDTVYVGGEKALDAQGQEAGVIYAIRGGQPQVVTTTAEGMTTALQVRGQWGVDPAGYLYMGSSIGQQRCSNDTVFENNNQFHRIQPELQNQLQRVARMCDFFKEQVVLTQRGTRWTATYRAAQHRGALPRMLLWSNSDQALYVVASNSGAVTNMPGVPETDQDGKPSATLFRIQAGSLNQLPMRTTIPPDTQTFDPANPADFDAHSKSAAYDAYVKDDSYIGNMTLLRHFSTGGDGELRNALDVTNTMTEVGDWIYGTSYSTSKTVTAVGGTLWRVHKTRGAASFQVVHRFSDASWDKAVENDGTNPAGPMVLAQDGNLYGTTTADVRALNARATAALGAGVLYRISAPASDDPIYEPLAYFDGDSTGVLPVGLSAGAVVEAAGGKRVQQLWGASRFGGAAGDTQAGIDADSRSGNGTVFRVDVPLPEIVLNSFTITAAISRPNTRPTLQWASSGTQSCTASGDWQGEYAATGSYRLPELTELRTYTYQLQCTGFAGKTETRSVSVQVIDGEGSGDTNRGGGAMGGALALWMALLAARRMRRAA